MPLIGAPKGAAAGAASEYRSRGANGGAWLLTDSTAGGVLRQGLMLTEGQGVGAVAAAGGTIEHTLVQPLYVGSLSSATRNTTYLVEAKLDGQTAWAPA
jgi:hypothetical protein